MPVTSKKFFLKDYAVPISIGIHDFEKATLQMVVINIEMHLEDLRLEMSDSIDDTINYDFLRTKIETLAKSRHFNLQETLCHEIIKMCKSVEGFKKITVSTNKPEIYDDCNTVGYEVTYDK
ncbi:MAG: dihydroneopterin aldolase [Proteobacteria bacterium]|nr:dihydroneopterin aldolase [Pseudomonadota bacterium]